ncbi:hypothetical protein HCTV5_133 [Halovirus HCTV-5]|uniref:hypothetical protein n=1 Tax=Halovirus HCTV-5 TaxID=1273748 RepID=UPI000334868C|nr:hypothetical protein M200_gp095 [Halovirus HCTV-5]AGM11739.1 hypothetical protein HCTV5_133 [Halovirus HCTV-5]
MSDLSEEKKLIWLGLKRPQADLSEINEEIDKLQQQLEDYNEFQTDLDGVADYTELQTYLENNGYTTEEAQTFINKIQNNFDDYAAFKDYVQNQSDSFTELKNAFNTNTTIGSEQETDGGQQVAGVKFFENDGYTKSGVFAPAGSTEVFGNEIHFSQTGAPTADSADISYSNLTISDQTPVPFQDVDISADITNNGNARGSVFAPLIEDGSVVSRQKVEIAAGATETVTFTREYEDYESIEVTIKNLPTQTITVVPPNLIQ